MSKPVDAPLVPCPRPRSALFQRVLLASVAVALAVPAVAQVPRIGADVYADETDIGFKVNVPDGWEFVPPSPDDGNVIAKYSPKTNNTVVLSPKTGMNLVLESWVLKFDRREKPKPGADGDLARRQHVDKNLTAWIKNSLSSGYAIRSQKELEIGKVPATETVFMKSFGDYDIGLYTVLYKLTPDVDVAVLYVAPGDPQKWGRYEPEFKKLGRSLKRLELKAGKAIVAAGDTLRDKKRALLQKETANQGDWELYETPNYFVVSNNDDKDFINQLMERLEAIREVYERDYPASRVDEIRATAARTGEPEKKPDDKAAPGSQASKKEPAPDPREMSRTSVVRVCKNREQYRSYGGPPNTGGFWYSVTEELVVFDDQAVLGRAKTWGTLYHEAFHQYIFYFYGNIAPHSWYNEGTGDFYSGYEYKNKRFTLDKPGERNGRIKEALREGKFVPLVELVRMTQKQYYGESKYGSDIGTHYAQGWALVYFLRTGEKNHAKGWTPRWNTILDDYLRALASSGKVEQAVEQAFSGVDMADLERAWLDYSE